MNQQQYSNQEPLYDIFDLKEFAMYQMYAHGEKKPNPRFLSMIDTSQIYIICLQEIDMSATAIMTSNSKNTILWVDMIRSRFGPKYQFEWKQMGAILLIVVIDTMLPDVKFDGFQTVARGFAKSFGNKGGVAATVQVKDSRYLFIGCHLSSDRSINGVKKRNNDILAIIQGCAFVNGSSAFYELVQDIAPRNQLRVFDKILDDTQLNLLKDNPDNYLKQQQFTEFDIPNIYRHVDFIFILGDMNFRVNSEVDMKIIADRLLKDQDYRREIYEKDQLTKQLRFLDTKYQVHQYEDIIPLKVEKPQTSKLSNQILSDSSVALSQAGTRDIESDLGEISVLSTKKRTTKSKPSTQTSIVAKKQGSNVNTSDSVHSLTRNSRQSKGDSQGRISDNESTHTDMESDDDDSTSMQYEGFQTEYALGLLHGFQEPVISFLPTYKYALVDEFDEFAVDVTKGHKARAPAYCDRVLFKQNCEDGKSFVKVQYYDSVQDYRYSDHRPVRLQISLPVRKVDNFRLSQFNAKIVEWTDYIQLQLKPSFALAHQQVKIRNVKYGMSQVVKIELENNHLISPCPVQVIRSSIPPFININPIEFVIQPKQHYFVKFDIRLQHIWNRSQDIEGFFRDYYKLSDKQLDMTQLKRRFIQELRNSREVSFRIKFMSKDIGKPCIQELYLTLYLDHQNFPSQTLEEHCSMQQRIYLKRLQFARNFKVIIIPMELLIIFDYFERVTIFKGKTLANQDVIQINQLQVIFHLICQQREKYKADIQMTLHYMILKNVTKLMFSQLSQIQQDSLKLLLKEIVDKIDSDEKYQSIDLGGIPQLLFGIVKEVVDNEKPTYVLTQQLKYDDEFYCLSRTREEFSRIVVYLLSMIKLVDQDNANLVYLSNLVEHSLSLENWLEIKRTEVFCSEIQNLETTLTKSINECNSAYLKLCFIPLHISPVVVMLSLLNFLSAYQDSICPLQFQNQLLHYLKENPKPNFNKMLRFISANITQTSRAILISLVSLIKKLINHPIIGPQLMQQNQAFCIRLGKVLSGIFFQINHESLYQFIEQLFTIQLVDLIEFNAL